MYLFKVILVLAVALLSLFLVTDARAMDPFSYSVDLHSKNQVNSNMRLHYDTQKSQQPTLIILRKRPSSSSFHDDDDDDK
ncbi:hypothetical protein LSTR_LSTR011469 [Laodelphax striatellus]|uniref:Transmembrane protein n=1 Tax=Laodelphax striatellus TaxID=195883 RepID=A0A482WH46_LAOST|nr:hypothetical protein LSTR_LSTR011469 [Laodelphax striatellus]